MKVKKVNQIRKSDTFFENLVDRNLGFSKRNLVFSDKNSKAVIKGTVEAATNKNESSAFLNNLPELLRPDVAASILGISLKTVYDWRYRCKQRKIPETLFLKINRLLLIRTSVLKTWIASQNPSLECEEKRE